MIECDIVDDECYVLEQDCFIPGMGQILQVSIQL